jgi:hypothetical protein
MAVLLSGKSIHIGLDWVTVLVPIISFLILASALNDLIGSASSGYFGLRDASRHTLQSGAYTIIIGLIFSLIAQTISVIKNETKGYGIPGFGGVPVFAGFGKIGLPKDLCSVENYNDIASSGKIGEEYGVIAKTAIRSGPEEEQFAKKILNIGDKVHFKNVLKATPNWFYINTIDSKIGGWCFAGHLKKG